MRPLRYSINVTLDSGVRVVAALAVAEQDAAFGLVRLGVGVNDDDDCLGVHVAHAYYHPTRGANISKTYIEDTASSLSRVSAVYPEP
jgi:hypothetical protein